MPVVTGPTGAELAGVCGVTEAETLLAWLLDHPTAQVDLGDCQHLHTAVLQVLLALKPAVAVEPADPLVAEWLLPLLAGSR
jgi:hypothetical protein